MNISRKRGTTVRWTGSGGGSDCVQEAWGQPLIPSLLHRRYDRSGRAERQRRQKSGEVLDGTSLETDPVREREQEPFGIIPGTVPHRSLGKPAERPVPRRRARQGGKAVPVAEGEERPDTPGLEQHPHPVGVVRPTVTPRHGPMAKHLVQRGRDVRRVLPVGEEVAVPDAMHLGRGRAPMPVGRPAPGGSDERGPTSDGCIGRWPKRKADLDGIAVVFEGAGFEVDDGDGPEKGVREGR